MWTVTPWSASTPTRDTTTSYTAGTVEAPDEITVGPDGRMWFTLEESSVLHAVDPATGIVTVVTDLFPSLSVVSDLVTGPDGRLWAVGFGNNSIAAYDIGDDTVEAWFDIRVLDPRSIVVGPAGDDLWFAEWNRDLVGRIDPVTGAITTYDSPVFRPEHLVAQAGGDLWVVPELGPYRLGRVDPATGAGTLVGPLERFRDVAVGPDGEIWTVGGTHVGRIDPASEDADRYLIPLWNGGNPFDRRLERIVAGDDGRLWFSHDSRLLEVEAGALGETDTTDPTIDLRTPADGGAYAVETTIEVDLDSADDGTVLTCLAGPNAFQAVVDGEDFVIHPRRTEFWSYARDDAGNTDEPRINYEAYPLCFGRRATVYPWSGTSPTPGRDVVLGDAAPFALRTLGGDDLVCGRFWIRAGLGDDVVFGLRSADRLEGGQGDDRLDGGRSDDLILGGPGFDVCIGGLGNDRFQGCEWVRQE